jgi:hypothetical protein
MEEAKGRLPERIAPNLDTTVQIFGLTGENYNALIAKALSGFGIRGNV